MEISEVQIKENHDQYLELVRSIEREGFDSEKLINYLESTDFFTAPASTKYHGAYRGGLVDHSICVYMNLLALVRAKGLEEIISPDSIKIVSLFHDFAKINYYEQYFRNVQYYCSEEEYNANPAKYKSFDEAGHFCWTKVKSFKTKDSETRFMYGNHEENSEYLVRQYVPMTFEESVSILKHHASMGFDSAKDDISSVYTKFPLACLLHLADMLATYVDQA